MVELFEEYSFLRYNAVQSDVTEKLFHPEDEGIVCVPLKCWET